MKILDVPSIVTAVLDLPVLFSSTGVLYPYFYPTGNVTELYSRMIMQLEQIQNYVKVYCDGVKEYWCKDKIANLTQHTEKFSADLNNTQLSEVEIATRVSDIHAIMCAEYTSFKSLWLTYSEA